MARRRRREPAVDQAVGQAAAEACLACMYRLFMAYDPGPGAGSANAAIRKEHDRLYELGIPPVERARSSIAS